MPESSRRQDPVRAPSQARSQQRVEQILQATKSLILESGCAGLKMSDIAKTAGISIGSIYQYYPNKHAIVAGLAQHYLDVFRQEVEAVLAEPASDLDTLMDTLIGLLGNYYRLHRNDPVVRDIWMGSATDKAIRDIDANETARNRELLFEQSKHLIHHSDHARARRAFALMVNYASSSVTTAVEQNEKEGRQMMELANEMLRACWEVSIKPLKRP